MCGADTSAFNTEGLTSGSSPRVRSRPSRPNCSAPTCGIISACAEQTGLSAAVVVGWGDHLRVCGADVFLRVLPGIRRGIISACAEQTSRLTSIWTSTGDHLRVCGADHLLPVAQHRIGGSSPRVRSRQDGTLPDDLPPRIISACAEQTEADATTTTPERDHLRVCGADRPRSRMASSRQGSSPRVRSRQRGYRVIVAPDGIISACAEQTVPGRPSARPPQDHLRVCGADPSPRNRSSTGWGSSPRVRSRPCRIRRPATRRRIISACAEQTPPFISRQIPNRDHLRVCGADLVTTLSNENEAGSSPRVRSRRQPSGRRASPVGIISACAEQTLRRRWCRP